MDKDVEKTYLIPGPWHYIRSIRKSARHFLCNFNERLIESALMAISELGENALKYGVSVPRMPKIEIKILVSGHGISIRVSNGFDSQKHLDRLNAHITRLKESRDPMELYVNRLQELTGSGQNAGGLGLYRVAAEGGFSIDYEVSEDIVVLIAQRSVNIGDSR